MSVKTGPLRQQGFIPGLNDPVSSESVQVKRIHPFDVRDLKHRGSPAFSLIDCPPYLQITSNQTIAVLTAPSTKSLKRQRQKLRKPFPPPNLPVVRYMQVQPRLKQPSQSFVAVQRASRAQFANSGIRGAARIGTRSVTVTQRPVNAATATVSTNLSNTTMMARTELCMQLVLDIETPRVVDFAINPSIDSLFPWLSRISPSFDQYSFTALKFRYVPSCGTTTTGQITMAIDYDPVDSNVGVQQSDVAAMAGSVSSQLYTPCAVTFQRALMPVASHKFFTSTDDSYSDAVRFCHVGRLLVCLSADPTTRTTYGALYVDYNVQLFAPQTAGPGFSNNGSITNNNPGHTATDPLGTVDQAVVVSTKPDAVATPAKTKRIVKIVEGIATVISKVAPYITFIAKLFLADACPNLPATYMNWLGQPTPIAFADIPGDNLVVISSSQCRGGVIIAYFYGTYTTLITTSRPVVTLIHSTNLTITTKLFFPHPVQNVPYIAATPVATICAAVAEFDFNDLSLDKGWFKPVITQSGSADMPAWTSLNYSFVNFFTKADIPSPP